MTELRDVINALEAKGCKPAEKKPDEWMAICPAHDDHDPSLRVRIHEGKLKLNCFGGCKDTEVYDVLELDYPWKTGKKKWDPDKGPQALPKGSTKTNYIYRDQDGKIAGAVTRTKKPPKKPGGKPDKTFSQWKYHSTTKDGTELYTPYQIPSPKPLYRLDLLKHRGTVAVVEGEKLVDAAAAIWKDRAITTFAGGSDNWRYSDWNPLRNRDVLLIADADQGGHRAMKGIGNHLQAMGCQVEICLPEDNDKSDLYDWIEAGTAAERIKTLRQPYVPDPEDQSTSDKLRANQHYRVLGLEHGRVVTWLREAGCIEIFPRGAMISQATLISLAPERFWYAQAGTEQLSPVICRRIGDGLIREADRLGEFDVRNILGRGAARLEDGEVVYHLGDRILRNGQERKLEEVPGVWQAEPAIPLATPATDDQLKAARDAILQYRFLTDQDGRRFLGWIAAAVAGGALDWRPHIILAAKASSGKSWLLNNVLEPLLGPLLRHYDHVTPAALAAEVSGTALPVAIDEAQPAGTNLQRLDAILELFRSASGGGIRAKADGRGGVTKQNLRFSGMLSATVSPNFGAPESSRITLIRFGGPVDSWLTVERSIRTALKHAAGIRARMIVEAGRIADQAREVALEIQSEGKDTRQSLITAALTAGHWFWSGAGADVDIVEGFTDTPDADDAVDALMAILAIPVRDPGGTDKTIADCLREPLYTDTIASTYGVRMDAGTLLINTSSKGLANALRRMQATGADLKQLLLQIDGAAQVPHPRWFGAYRTRRAIMIPPRVLEALGLSLDIVPKNQSDLGLNGQEQAQ